jgi:hypothetical protein
MAHFKLISLDRLLGSIEFEAVSVASVLDITLRGTLGETDVYCDGPYKFTISHGTNGVWAITQRKMSLGYGAKFGSQAATPRADLQALFRPQSEMA